jgi:hypothetical protein
MCHRGGITGTAGDIPYQFQGINLGNNRRLLYPWNLKWTSGTAGYITSVLRP